MLARLSRVAATLCALVRICGALAAIAGGHVGLDGLRTAVASVGQVEQLTAIAEDGMDTIDDLLRIDRIGGVVSR